MLRVGLRLELCSIVDTCDGTCGKHPFQEYCRREVQAPRMRCSICRIRLRSTFLLLAFAILYRSPLVSMEDHVCDMV